MTPEDLSQMYKDMHEGDEDLTLAACERALAAQKKEPDEIRTLTLHFPSRGIAVRFYELADRMGHKPSHGRDRGWHTVTAIFQNKAARSKLVSAWARESMLVAE